MSNLPLNNLLVLSLEQAVAAPYASCRLADAGARVIKIERSQGDFARRYDSVVNGESAYFVWLNRGKESLLADIKNPRDQALLHSILAQADVFIQNLAPGAAARAGFDSQHLRQQYPKLITCDISGYGEQGDYSQRKAYDLLVQAESGLAAITGSPEQAGRVGVSVCDIAAGMHALIGIQQALIARQQTGRGQGVKVSLFDGMADWMSVPLLHQEYSGQAPQRVGLNHPSIAPYGVYCASGGEQVLLSIQNEREWQSFCGQVLQLPELVAATDFANNEVRVVNRERLDQQIAKVFAQIHVDQLVVRLEQAQIAFGRLNEVADLAAHPQLRRTPVQTAAGPMQQVAAPIRFVDQQGNIREDAWQPVPDLGEHDARIRDEFKADEIDADAKQ